MAVPRKHPFGDVAGNCFDGLLTRSALCQAIGSENLTRPGIKQAIDDYFASATVSAEETLQELAKLARGNSKDKIRALALLASHHGLLDGSWRKTPGACPNRKDDGPGKQAGSNHA